MKHEAMNVVMTVFTSWVYKGASRPTVVGRVEAHEDNPLINFLKSISGSQNGVYKPPQSLYTKTRQTFIYFETTSKIEVNKHE